jgi:hypothetical protein
LAAVLNLAEVTQLLSTEHFTVDGTLIQAWASMKSFRRKDGKDQPPAPGRNGTRDFHKEKRSTKPMRRGPIRTPGWSGKGPGRRRNCRIMAICSWKTATD